MEALVSGIRDYPVFLGAVVVLTLAPGQVTLYVLGRSLAHGERTGVAAALGVGTGGLIHAVTCALGLSAVLATSGAAFSVVKYAGAAYLTYLGVRLLLEKRPSGQIESTTEAGTSFWRSYTRGVVTNVLNPKAALFFLAFLPQFVEPGSRTGEIPLLALGFTFAFTGTVWCLILAVAAGRLSGALRRSRAAGIVLQRASGCLFLYLAARLALARHE